MVDRQFKKEALNDSEVIKNPGPGEYKVPEKSVEGPQYHFGLKNSSSLINFSAKEIPGPGQYTPQQEIFTTVGYSMGMKGEGSFSSREGPGPGSYAYNSMFQRIKGAATFGRFSRMEANLPNKSATNGETSGDK
eukprot:CAMPEP_0170553386 /NCGR_PEP_ID=MMETSP0211-20121228/11201_1 /TAXON_ID=311385 /ORGANISM="Pseudokeronopsis sp., Strain OXSARD2" /LENGTH=133 /DNA_ID=CAMNT_0010861673 /DNA_START=147 /DNA_END=549 /DNA_ORIENTATION=+